MLVAAPHLSLCLATSHADWDPCLGTDLPGLTSGLPPCYGLAWWSGLLASPGLSVFGYRGTAPLARDTLPLTRCPSRGSTAPAAPRQARGTGCLHPLPHHLSMHSTCPGFPTSPNLVIRAPMQTLAEGRHCTSGKVQWVWHVPKATHCEFATIAEP